MKKDYTLMTLPFIFALFLSGCSPIVALPPTPTENNVTALATQTAPPLATPIPTQALPIPTQTLTEAPESLAIDLSTIWDFGGLALGTIDGPPTLGSLLMPDVVKFPDGTYRLYFNQSKGPGKDYVAYAESMDGQTWEFRGTVLSAATDPSDKFYILGGPRVVPLPDGRYRMYFRASPEHKQGVPPKYKAYSAISDDGIHFTVEDGIRIDISPDDPSSPFALAGHGAFYQAKDGRYVGIISADPVNSKGPSDLFIGYSSDGLTWGDFALLYEDFHDPAVIRKGDQYYLFATLMDIATFAGISSDGISWPSQAALTRLTFYDQNDVDVSAHVGDVGAMIAPNDELWILTNWNKERKPGSVSTAIAFFVPSDK